MDISYKGTWGYHPLLVTLANTGEVLSLVNRSGNRPCEEMFNEFWNKHRVVPPAPYDKIYEPKK